MTSSLLLFSRYYITHVNQLMFFVYNFCSIHFFFVSFSYLFFFLMIRNKNIQFSVQKVYKSSDFKYVYTIMQQVKLQRFFSLTYQGSSGKIAKVSLQIFSDDQFGSVLYFLLSVLSETFFTLKFAGFFISPHTFLQKYTRTRFLSLAVFPAHRRYIHPYVWYR